jgi:hypothetical protein
MRGATREPGAECAKSATTPCGACCAGRRRSGLRCWGRMARWGCFALTRVAARHPLVRSSRPKPAKGGRGKWNARRPQRPHEAGATRWPGAECAKSATTPCGACHVGSRRSGLRCWRQRFGGVALPSPVSLRDTSPGSSPGAGSLPRRAGEVKPNARNAQRPHEGGPRGRLVPNAQNPQQPHAGPAALEAAGRACATGGEGSVGCSSAGPMITDNTSCNLRRCGRPYPHPRRLDPRIKRPGAGSLSPERARCTVGGAGSGHDEHAPDRAARSSGREIHDKAKRVATIQQTVQDGCSDADLFAASVSILGVVMPAPNVAAPQMKALPTSANARTADRQSGNAPATLAASTVRQARAAFRGSRSGTGSCQGMGGARPATRTEEYA